MNFVDYILIAVLLVFFISGYRRGFVLQAIGIVGVLAALWLAARYHVALASSSLLSGLQERSETAALVAAFVGIFFAVAAVAGVLAHWLGRKLRHSAVRGGDKWAGGILGAVKAVVLLGGLAIGLQQWGFPTGVVVPAHLQEKGEGALRESVLVPRLADACLWVVDLIPQERREALVETYRDETRRILGIVRKPEEGNVSTTGKAAEGAKGAKGASRGTGAAGKRAKEPAAEAGSADASARPVAAVRPLIGLGAWRHLVLEESEAAEPVPASARFDTDRARAKPKAASGNEATP